MTRHVCLRLLEQYLDSFLYSGTLFLLGKDGVLSSFDWGSIVRQTLGAHSRMDLLSIFLDSRQQCALNSRDNSLALEIPNPILNASRTSAIRWHVWPTDLNIYSNRIYISDESGVHTAAFNYALKSIDGNEFRHVKTGYVYSISPGEGGRLAIAGVEDGLTILIQGGEEKVLVEDDVFDCDWFGTKLVANSTSSAYLAEFVALPKRESYPDDREYFASLNLARKSDPTTVRLDAAPFSEYRWLAGEKVVEDVPQTDNGAATESSRVIRARSASFGSVVEYSDRIVIQRSNYRDTLDVHTPIFWRTFSRSNSYLNHLHVCDENGMQIRAYETSAVIGDRFSVELSDS
jgi:hypothetical protein